MSNFGSKYDALGHAIQTGIGYEYAIDPETKDLPEDFST